MRLAYLLPVAALLADCRQQPQRQPKMSDAQLRLMHAAMPGMTAECLEKIKWGGIEAIPREDDQCFKFTAPTRMKGLWRNQFEGSEFCDAAARQCRNPNEANDLKSFTWLEMKSPLGGRADTPPGGLYAIDFVGRRSQGDGGFGHFGMAKHEVIVDRLLSIRLVEPPPPGQMTREHIQGYLKDCAKAQICMPNSEVPSRR